MNINRCIFFKLLAIFCFILVLYTIIHFKIFDNNLVYITRLTSSGFAESSVESKIVDCKQFSDLTSYCIYKNICMKNREFYFLTNNKSLQKKSFQYNGKINNWDHYEQIDDSGTPIENTAGNPLPFRSFINGRYENPWILNISKTFNKGCHAVLNFDSENQNIFHWSIKITPLFIYLNFHKVNSCLNFDSIHLLNRKRSDLSDWQKKFLEISTDVEENRQKFEETGLECFETMLVPGTATFLFTGPKEAIHFRRKLEKKLNVNFDRSRVVFAKRRNRLILNQNEFENFIRSKIDKNYLDIIYLEDLNFEQQVRLMSQTRLFISIHGAGLTNTIFMPSTSILLEITPPHFHYPLYEKIAIQSGHIYFRFVTDADPSIHSKNYLNTTSRECFRINECIVFWKNKNIRINITKFSFMFEQIMEVL